MTTSTCSPKRQPAAALHVVVAVAVAMPTETVTVAGAAVAALAASRVLGGLQVDPSMREDSHIWGHRSAAPRHRPQAAHRITHR